MVIPPNAAYVSRDGLVTFDENGRKLDSLGNVAWADTQTLKGADARPLERPTAPPPPPQAQRAAAAVAPAPRFYAAPTPPPGAFGQPQYTPLVPGMTDYKPPKPSSQGSNPYNTPPGYGAYSPPKPTTPFAANPNPGPATGGGPAMGGGYMPSMYTGPSTTDTTSWESQVTMPGYQAPQPVVDPWAVAPGAPYTPSNAGGYPDNVKAEAQRSAPRFDDGTQWGYTSPQFPPPVDPAGQPLPPPSGPVGPGPSWQGEYYGREPRDIMDMIQKRKLNLQDSMAGQYPMQGMQPFQGYGPGSPLSGTDPFQGYGPPNPMQGTQPFQRYGR